MLIFCIVVEFNIRRPHFCQFQSYSSLPCSTNRWIPMLFPSCLGFNFLKNLILFEKTHQHYLFVYVTHQYYGFCLYYYVTQHYYGFCLYYYVTSPKNPGGPCLFVDSLFGNIISKVQVISQERVYSDRHSLHC